jgi:transcriptional activator of cad operon
MESLTTKMLRIGSWCVNPASGQISRDRETAKVEVRTMRLLVCLAERAGEVVSIDDLLGQVWSDVTVTPDSVYQAVASLRRLLGDDPKQPTYIETVPRLGYRMVAKVSPWEQKSVAAPALPTTDAGRRAGYIWAGFAVLCILLVVGFQFQNNVTKKTYLDIFAVAPAPQKSIGVLPFLDLTDKMDQEPFADGMTEELIDKLSKVPGLRVPPPTSSFYFKGKLWPRADGTVQISIADIAKKLGVAYVLDGSVRKSGSRLRVAARLIRADNGFVVWSETYDRAFDDILKVQDEIAGEVTKALRASIGSEPKQ